MKMSDDHLLAALMQVAKTESDDGEFRIEEHVDHMAYERLKFLMEENANIKKALVGMIHGIKDPMEVQENLVLNQPEEYSAILRRLMVKHGLIE